MTKTQEQFWLNRHDFVNKRLNRHLRDYMSNSTTDTVELASGLISQKVKPCHWLCTINVLLNMHLQQCIIHGVFQSVPLREELCIVANTIFPNVNDGRDMYLQYLMVQHKHYWLIVLIMKKMKMISPWNVIQVACSWHISIPRKCLASNV